MKNFRKVVVWFFLVIAFTIVGLLSYVKFALPDVGVAPDLKVEITPARLQRGEYLANHVSLCVDCHSTRDWSKLGGPITPGSIGAGGELFDKMMGLPGTYYAPNITPYALKDWTDGEILRAITTGVSKKGNALFPIMPYTHFREMDKEDIYSIITYIRTLPYQKTQVTPSSSDFPMNFIINTIPAKADFKNIPAENDQIAYGKYLVNAASCSECHTIKDNGENVLGMDFAGGNQFRFEDVTMTSANITPDLETGIGKWSKEDFLNRFKAYRDIAKSPKHRMKGEFQTVMPWTMFSGMKDSDIEAIYIYLKTVKPVKNKIATFTVN